MTWLIFYASAPGPGWSHPAHHGVLDRALHGAAHLGNRVLRGVIDLAHDRPYVPLGLVLLCIAAALCYAASSVLQQREAQAAPPEMAMRLGLLAHLIRRPLWLVGNLADVGGFGFQFLALRTGSLALVQPLLVTGLLFSLVGSAYLEHRRLKGREWMWTAITMAGLIAFLSASQPGPGDPRASTTGWLLLGLATLMTVGALSLSGRAWPRWRALNLGAATGVLFGVVAALTEASAHLLDHGILHALAHWQPYALIVCAVAGLALSQSAFQAGDLKWSLPALTVVEPPVAILIGQLLFGEHINLSGGAPLAEGLGLAAMAAGVFGLARAEAAVVKPLPSGATR